MPVEIPKNKDEHIQELLDGFSFIEPNILYIKRIANPTLYQIEQTHLLTLEWIHKYSCKNVIVDLEHTNLSDRIGRAQMRKDFPEGTKDIEHLVLIINNSIVRSALKFFLLTLTVHCKITVVASKEEALNKLNPNRA